MIVAILRGLVAAWAVIGVVGYAVEWVLFRSAQLIGPEWFSSAQLVSGGGVLWLAGWTAARTAGRPQPLLPVVVGITLMVRDLDPLLPLNGPWLFRLAGDTLGSTRYLAAFLMTAVIHAALLSCLGWGHSAYRRTYPK